MTLDMQESMIEAISPANTQYALTRYKAKLIERLEEEKKNTDITKQAELALKMREKYTLQQIRYLVKGYNQALDEIIAIIKEL